MKIICPLLPVLLLLFGCSEDLSTIGKTSNAPLASIGPSDCQFIINLDLETYQVISTEDGSDLSQFSEVQCALLEPTFDSFTMSGCIDQYGNGTVTMNCIPGLIEFPSLDQIPPDTEPQECEITIDGNNLQIVDEAGTVLFDGPFGENAFEPFSEAIAMALTPPQQVHQLEIEALQKGGELITVNQNLHTLNIPATADEPQTLLSYDPINNIVLNTIQINEEQKIDYSIYYHYEFNNSIPVLSKITERQRFKIEGYTVPLIRKSYYKYNTYQFEQL